MFAEAHVCDAEAVRWLNAPQEFPATSSFRSR
jgi:hypothetical protein